MKILLEPYTRSKMPLQSNINPYLVPAISTAKNLQSIIRKMVEKEKDIKVSVATDTKFPAQVVKDFMKEIEDVEPFDEETELLAMIDNLLYKLYDFEREVDTWHDEEQVEKRTQLKLKEILTKR